MTPRQEHRHSVFALHEQLALPNVFYTIPASEKAKRTTTTTAKKLKTTNKTAVFFHVSTEATYSLLGVGWGVGGSATYE